MAQKFVIAGLYLSLAAMVVVSALDHRFGWSPVPAALCLAGDVLVAGGLGVVALVLIQNGYAAATVQARRSSPPVCMGRCDTRCTPAMSSCPSASPSRWVPTGDLSSLYLA